MQLKKIKLISLYIWHVYQMIPTYELNSELSKKINYDCFEDLVKISKIM